MGNMKNICLDLITFSRIVLSKSCRMSAILVAVILLVSASSLEALQCYTGFVEINKPLAISVRKSSCSFFQNRCYTMKATDTIDGVKQETITGGCGNPTSVYQCKLLAPTFKSRTACEAKVCSSGDFCNKEVEAAEQKVIEKFGKQGGKRLKCNTGQLIDLPMFVPSNDIPKKVDECFASTTECVSLKYKMKFKFGKLPSMNFRVAHGICKSPDIKCEDYCKTFEKLINITDCKVMCCSTDECNPMQFS